MREFRSILFTVRCSSENDTFQHFPVISLFVTFIPEHGDLENFMLKRKGQMDTEISFIAFNYGILMFAILAS